MPTIIVRRSRRTVLFGALMVKRRFKKEGVVFEHVSLLAHPEGLSDQFRLEEDVTGYYDFMVANMNGYMNPCEPFTDGDFKLMKGSTSWTMVYPIYLPSRFRRLYEELANLMTSFAGGRGQYETEKLIKFLAFASKGRSTDKKLDFEGLLDTLVQEIMKIVLNIPRVIPYGKSEADMLLKK
jgi:hypothetical protein